MKKSIKKANVQPIIIDHSNKRKIVCSFILEDTRILDDDIQLKFSNQFDEVVDRFLSNKIYQISVAFPFKYLSILYQDAHQTNCKKDQSVFISEISDSSLAVIENFVETMQERCVQVSSASINGESIVNENFVSVEIYEDLTEPMYGGKGKNKGLNKVFFVNLDANFTREKISELATKELVKLFFIYLNGVNNNQLAAEILGIESTEINELFRAFATQYYELFLCTKERYEELIYQLQEKTNDVFKQHGYVN